MALPINIEQVLEQLDLYTGPAEDRLLKNVAAMVFCEAPHRFFPYTRVDIVTFPEGITRNPNNMIEVPPITGSIPMMIRATLDYLRTNVIKAQIIKPKERAESIRYFNYPYQALEEAVVNALYHRDYQQHEPVEIRIQPDSITILSYSGPDRSITEEALRKAQLLQARRHRNRRLGDFLKELKLSEGRATGIPTIQDELRRNGSAEAIIETDEDRSYFMITIPCHPLFVNDTINGRWRVILQQMVEYPQIPKHQLAIALNVSISTISRDIKRLISAGFIQREGSNKNGSWIVLKEIIRNDAYLIR